MSYPRPTAEIERFARALPKTELHLHIEGSLEPELMMRLAERNAIALPYQDVDALRAAYSFGCLQDFLDLYYAGCDVLRTAEDFHDLTAAYLERAHADQVRHVELFFDPQSHTPRGVAFEAVLDGITSALDAGRRAHGITSEVIMCFLRHLDEEDAHATLELALPHRERIVGVGLDSSEKGHPPEKFTRVFTAAREAGFRTVAHAGEEGPAEYVRTALDQLGVSRVDHGNAALDDAELVARLAAERMPLTVCPLSNLALCVVEDLRAHPLRAMLDAGLCATIHSDDPAYFGGYVADNYVAMAGALGLGRDELVTLARNGIEASFATAERKAELERELDAFARR
ncbi:Adenine deaminase [Planctomycetes bacterium Pla163]|uniref:Adenine deaminase n=1 Tax=Rohdeia mirabilis TaxID=2528008 RepID=A0A518D0S2_9BACT|nr:Adenine deaminase [Planctomycetes bacterium Pla163]